MSSTVSVFCVILLLCAVSLYGGKCEPLDRDANFCFSFDGLKKNRSFESEFSLYGDAKVSGSVLRVTGPAGLSSGLIMYGKAVKFFGTKPGFSSYLLFSLSPGDRRTLAFFLSSATAPLRSSEGDGVGDSSSLVKVKFRTSMGSKFGNDSGISVEIDAAGELLMESSSLSGVGLVLNSGEKLHSWINYDGESNRLQVRVSQSRNKSRPVNSSTSYSINLSNILWRGAVFVGISSSSENSTESNNLYSWNFIVKHGTPYLLHSEPLDPNSFLLRPHESSKIHPRKGYTWGVFMALVFAAACGAMLAFFVMFVWFALISRRPVAPVEYPVHPVDAACGKVASIKDKHLENSKLQLGN